MTTEDKVARLLADHGYSDDKSRKFLENMAKHNDASFVTKHEFNDYKNEIELRIQKERNIVLAAIVMFILGSKFLFHFFL